jgi:hypothetical protein
MIDGMVQNLSNMMTKLCLVTNIECIALTLCEVDT